MADGWPSNRTWFREGAIKLKAMLLNRLGAQLEPGEVSIPSVKPGYALVRVRAVGVCQTDLKIIAGGHISSSRVSFPHILGHEVSGVVAEIGQGVTNVKAGDRVAVSMYANCGECSYCRAGRDTLCDNLTAWTGFDTWGGMADYVLIKARNLVSLPLEVSYPEAAILGDAVATSLHAVRERSRVRPGQTVLIVGPGGVGIHAVQIARHMGARVIAADITAEKLALSREFGAHELLISDEHLPERVRELTGGHGVDHALDFTGIPEVQLLAGKALRKGGRLCLVGYRNDRNFSLPSMDIAMLELEVVGSRACSVNEIAEAVEWVRRGWLKPFVSRILPLEQANEALDLLRTAGTVGRIVLEVSGD